MYKRYLLFLLILQPPLYCSKTDTGNVIENISKQYLGDPYVWGGNTPKTGMDCSGYTKYVFKKVGINIPRTAFTQSKVGKTVDQNHLKKGDLLFFLTDKKRGIPVTHVGIYLNNGKFIHAASKKKGIIISSLNGLYGKKFVSAKRIFASSKKNISLNEKINNYPSQNTNMDFIFSSILDKEASMAKIAITPTSFSNFKRF